MAVPGLAVDIGVFDWALALEIMEHIPPKYEKTALDNIVRSARKGVVCSWAVPNQGGHAHVNELSNDGTNGFLVVESCREL